MLTYRFACICLGVLLLILGFFSDTYAQAPTPVDSIPFQKRTGLLLNGPGRRVFHSLQFEFQKRLLPGITLVIQPGVMGGPNAGVTGSFTLSSGILLGKGPHFAEATIGGLAGVIVDFDAPGNVQPALGFGGVVGQSVVAYRFMPRKPSVGFRIGYNPFFGIKTPFFLLHKQQGQVTHTVFAGLVFFIHPNLRRSPYRQPASLESQDE